MPEKCFWCAQESSDSHDKEMIFKGKANIVKLCSTDCEQKLRNYVEYAESHNKHYILGFTLSIVIGLIVTFWRIKIDYGALGTFIIFAGSGLTLVKYPFATPQTVSSLGAKRAIASGRFIGCLNIFIGIAFWLFLAVVLT
jgi:hypothetical protein